MPAASLGADASLRRRKDRGRHEHLRAISMPAILWSVDTLDWKTRDASQTIQTVLEKVKDGDIILMHDLSMRLAMPVRRSSRSW